MRTKLTLATGLAAAVAAVAPFGALGFGNPVLVLDGDLATLASAVKNAQTTLSADLAKIQASTGKPAAKTAYAKFKADKATLIGAIQTARGTVKSDLADVHAEKAGTPDDKAATKKQLAADKAALAEITAAAKQALAAAKAAG